MAVDVQTETVRSTALRVWALLLGMGLLLAGAGLQASLLGLVSEDSGFSSTVTGVIMTAYYAGFLLGSNVAESFISKVGHVRTFAALASLGSVAILVHGLFIDPAVWSAMRFVTGLSFAGLYVVTESWLNRETTSQNRGGVLAVYMIVTHTGLAGGQSLLIVAPSSGLVLYIIASIILSIAVVPILLSTTPQPQIEQDSERLGLLALWKITPLGAAGCFFAGVASGIMFGMGAVYIRQLGFGVGMISAFMAAIMLGGAVFQWPVGKLSDTFDRRHVILGVALATSASAAVLHLTTLNETGLIIAGFVLGGLASTLYPLSLSYANDWFNADQMVSASNGLVTFYGAGALFGPLGTGVLMGAMGPVGFVVYIVALMLGVAAFTAYRMTLNDGPDSQEDFLYAPSAIGVNEVWAEAAAEAAEESNEDEASPRRD